VAKKSNLVRTISYWRLVNAVDHAFIEQADWSALLAKWSTGDPVKASWEGEDYTATVYTLDEVPWRRRAVGSRRVLTAALTCQRRCLTY
jgi:hypothetical protein